MKQFSPSRFLFLSTQITPGKSKPISKPTPIPNRQSPTPNPQPHKKMSKLTSVKGNRLLQSQLSSVLESHDRHRS